MAMKKDTIKPGRDKDLYIFFIGHSVSRSLILFWEICGLILDAAVSHIILLTFLTLSPSSKHV